MNRRAVIGIFINGGPRQVDASDSKPAPIRLVDSHLPGFDLEVRHLLR